MILTLKFIMKERSLSTNARSSLSKVIYAHNLFLSFGSAIMGSIMVYETLADGRYNSWNDLACRVTPNVGLYGLVNFCYLWSKVYEFLDTVFLCLLKKKVIVLHFWHHMTTFALTSVVFNFPSGAFAYINCFIHTLMYLHYAHPSKFARPIMTSLQILQFIVMIGIHVYTYASGCHPAPTLYFPEFLCDLILCLSYLILFINFYLQQYTSKPSASKKE